VKQITASLGIALPTRSKILTALETLGIGTVGGLLFLWAHLPGGLITGAMFAPVLVFCTKFERRYKVLARRAQDQDGDLTTLVEEAATGVRVLKALGRGPEAARAHLAQAAKLGDTRIGMARLLGGFWSTLDLVPNAVIALAVVLGAVTGSAGTFTVTFTVPVEVSPWPSFTV